MLKFYINYTYDKGSLLVKSILIYLYVNDYIRMYILKFIHKVTCIFIIKIVCVLLDFKNKPTNP